MASTPDQAPETKPQRSITLRSSDNHDFSISESAAALSITVKSALEDNCSEGVVIPLQNVNAETLAHVVAYLNAHATGDGVRKRDIDGEFVADKKIEALIDIVAAASYLNIQSLVELMSRSVADRIKNKSVEWMRKAFRVENDYTAEEEAEIRSQYPWDWEGDVNDDNDDELKSLGF